MATHSTLADLEISQTADRLVIRGRKIAVVLSVIAVLLFVPFSTCVAYQNIVGTSQVPAVWDRPTHGRIAILLILLIMVLPFGIGSIMACIVYVRRRRCPWVFDRHRRVLMKHARSWPLEEVTDVAVEVGKWKKFARIVLYFRDVQTLEIARFSSGRQVSIESRIVVAGQLASLIGEFLQVPVRHARAGQGFEVVMPVGP